MSEDKLRSVIDSVDNMVLKQERTLLENLPSEDEVRRKLDDYKALKEDLQKLRESLIQ
jgi:hypothetical protein